MILGTNPHSYLNKLLDFVVCYSKVIQIITIAKSKSNNASGGVPNSNVQTFNLTELMNNYGSDKGAYHGYTELYEKVLNGKRFKVKRVLEVGIGTNNPSLFSNMGILGKPGASLRAWRDYFPNATIVGLDIDKNILFTEKSISTDFVDQLDVDSFKSVTKKINVPLDVVIIDGLHTPRADFNSLVNFLPLMSDDGDFFIEDVGNLALKFFWPPILIILGKKYRITKYELNVGNLIHITRGQVIV